MGTMTKFRFHTRMIQAGLALVTGVLPLTAQVGVDAWPEYRGTGSDGQASESRPPTSWNEDSNVTWKTPIHGRGWSSPVVLEGRVWLTTATEEGHQLSVLAIDLESGTLLVDRVLFEVAEPQERNSLNSFASPSAVLEPGRVYIHFGDAGTACLDSKSGETIWERRDIRCEHLEGPGSSPILFGGSLIFHVDGSDVQYVIALDKATGETLWQTKRDVDLSGFKPDLRKAFSTPLVVEVSGRQELISTGAQATFAYDPATGKTLWSIPHDGFSMSSRPFQGGDLVYLNTGFMRPRLMAVQPGTGAGTGTEAGEFKAEDRVQWSTANGVPTIPTPVFYDGLITMISDGGIATCLDGLSGDVVWKERIGGEFSASPVLAGGNIYLFDRDGIAKVLVAGPTFEILTTNELDSGCMASPAIVGDSLIVRTKTHLYRLGADGNGGEGPR